jgi:hypothetical protein
MTALYPHSAEEHASGPGSIAVPSRTGVGPNTRLTGDQCQGKAPVRLTPPRGGVQTRPVRRQLRVPSRRRACPKGTAMVVGKSTSLLRAPWLTTAAGATSSSCPVGNVLHLTLLAAFERQGWGGFRSFADTCTNGLVAP